MPLIWFSCRLPRYTVHIHTERKREGKQYKYKQSYMQFSIVRLEARSHTNNSHLPVCVVYFDVLWNLTHDFSHCISMYLSLFTCFSQTSHRDSSNNYINIIATIDKKSRTINGVDNKYDACNCKCDTIYLSRLNQQFYSVTYKLLVMNAFESTWSKPIHEWNN